MLVLILIILFYCKGYKEIRSCTKFIIKWQLKTINTSYERIWKISLLELIKTYSENKNLINKYRYFLESNIDGVKRLLVLVYLNRDNDAKRFKTRIYYLSKGVIKNYKVIINRKYHKSISILNLGLMGLFKR